MDKILQKKNEKYQKLIAAAFDLFENNGISAVSIDDIVKKAGVAKGTFYLYFKDKFDLISKLILKKAAEYMNLTSEIPDIKNDEDFDRCIKKYIDLLVEFLEKNKTLTLLIDKNVHICVNAVIENREGTVKELYDKILLYFEGLGFSPQEISIKMYLCIDLIVSSCCNAILRGKPYSLNEVKPHLYDIVVMSIYGAEQARKQESL
ncbi:MAG: TetR/AcrR family transcriptional regulator [Candidatus Fimenecus sp.]